MDRQSTPYLKLLFLRKLNMNAVTATTSMMTYWMMVTDEDAQKESAGTSVNERLHCSMFTAYFWKGKIAE